MENNNEYQFSVEGFSGPFDLLLQLAKQHEIEITEISLDLLIDQYIDFIQKVQEQGLDIRSGYLEMAAELLRLKSVSILNYNANLELELEEEELAVDRQEMIRRLLEYKKYKEIVGDFNHLIDNRSNFLTRPQDKMMEYRDDNFKSNFDVDKFYIATKNYLRHYQEKTEKKEISVKELNVEDYMDHLKILTQPFSFDEVVKTLNKHQFITLFLAILESLKLGYIEVEVSEQLIITINPGVNNE